MPSKPYILSLLLFSWLSLPLHAQEVVLSDDFESGALAPHWNFDDSPFETGTVDIGGGLVDGTMRLEVTAFSDFWGGFALRTERTFAASIENPLTYQVTRVSDEGIGITRSGAWIMNSDRSQYILVSQNIGEGGWQYNRQIGQEGDSATGAGVNMDAYDELDEDFGAHVIRLVANGSSVQIFLNDEWVRKSTFLSLKASCSVSVPTRARPKTMQSQVLTMSRSSLTFLPAFLAPPSTPHKQRCSEERTHQRQSTFPAYTWQTLPPVSPSQVTTLKSPR